VFTSDQFFAIGWKNGVGEVEKFSRAFRKKARCCPNAKLVLALILRFQGGGGALREGRKRGLVRMKERRANANWQQIGLAGRGKLGPGK